MVAQQLTDVTKKVSDFIVRTEFEAIPEKCLKKAKEVILDCLGVAIAGSLEMGSKKIIDVVREERSYPVAGIIAGGFKTSAMNAALANGTLSHILDMNETNDSMRGFPTAPVLPAVLALGEERQISGKEVLTAYLVGFEVESKIGSAVNMEHYERGWHTSCTLGTLGSAAACAKISNLDLEQTMMTLGIACSEASGLKKNFGTMTKGFHAGISARNGVLAAKLAEKGFTASKNILEGEGGFCDLFSSKDSCDKLSKISEKLGNPYDIVFPGVNLKIYPSCSLTHPAIDAVLALVKKYKVKPEDIAKIKCGVDYRVPKTLFYSQPQTGMEGKFSMEFSLAIAILDGTVKIAQYSNEKVRDQKTRDLMKKIEVYVHPDLKDRESLKRKFTLVDIELENGKTLSKKIENPKGSPQNPLSRDELVNKFRECSSVIFSEKEIRKLIEMIENLEYMKNLSELTRLLTRV